MEPQSLDRHLLLVQAYREVSGLDHYVFRLLAKLLAQELHDVGNCLIFAFGLNFELQKWVDVVAGAVFEQLGH